ncbi:hypothetical protein Fleli_2949 [Bernardetia litoralis DSM 6794]|uniref:Uncharacterized protein n=1 Tax=Bernardetia litoralis (strain ATCC 23117 / DSM 6794 / NBRC 15988 / NCIMB 1366 / Fx l1 / Sio-4) TaxID=880071 RepID=I4AMW1_BERLS|nr:hypothetical protein [Bernardetia litoralis]AFM05296.1 hypothetical protein Fleli_2949 [Bernardetia litoralis DSM 6794]
MKLKRIVLFIAIISFLESCGSYKNISETGLISITEIPQKEYTFVKKFNILHRKQWIYPEGFNYNCVFSKGTEYKFRLEKGKTNIKLYKGNRRKAMINVNLDSSNNQIVLKCMQTGVYKLKGMSFVENETAVIGLYFNRSDNTDFK